MNSHSHRFDLVVFDWDGTLYDSTAAIVNSIQAASRDVGAVVPTRSQAAYVIGMSLQEALKYAVPGLRTEEYPELVARYRHHYVANQHRLALFEGALDMLHELKAHGHKLAVATGKSRRGLDDALATVQLKGLFDTTRTADETASKPDPMMLIEIMRELDIAPDRTLMIGDTTHDLQLATNAGAASLAVSYGAHDFETFDEFKPLYVAHTVAELRGWLGANG